MPHLEWSLELISVTMNFKVMGISIVFEYSVFDNYYIDFHTKVMSTVAFNQINAVHTKH